MFGSAVLARDEFGAASVQFMLDALVSLQKNLEAGSRLIVREDSLTELVISQGSGRVGDLLES
ncbi:MAG: hypothetical protein R3F23_04975 [Verrucomicrobiia bacterium]